MELCESKNTQGVTTLLVIRIFSLLIQLPIQNRNPLSGSLKDAYKPLTSEAGELIVRLS